MADSAEIQWVQDNLERDADSHGFTSVEIARRLDAGANKWRVAEAYWTIRANETIELVNTSESGSSRGNDAIYSRMKAKADDFGKAAQTEEDKANTATVQRLGSFDIERV